MDIKWISVNEKLPERGQLCLFIVDIEHSWHHRKIYGGRYTGNPDSKYEQFEFATPGVGYVASHWWPVPEELLNVPECKPRQKLPD